jgi:hypothetical protein
LKIYFAEEFMKRTWWICLILAVSGGGTSLLRADVVYSVTVDTTTLAGAGGYMAFDLLGGTPLEDNIATITGFASTSTLGSGSTSGDVTGTLTPGPLTLTADQFFNEWLQAVTYGSGLTTFTLDLTTDYILASAPDSFSFFLLDSGFNPITTSDPSGADSLFSIDLVGSATSPAVYTSTSATASVTPAPAGTPEPRTLWLVWLALLIGGGYRGRKWITRSALAV